MTKLYTKTTDEVKVKEKLDEMIGKQEQVKTDIGEVLKLCLKSLDALAAEYANSRKMSEKTAEQNRSDIKELFSKKDNLLEDIERIRQNIEGIKSELKADIENIKNKMIEEIKEQSKEINKMSNRLAGLNVIGTLGLLAVTSVVGLAFYLIRVNVA